MQHFASSPVCVCNMCVWPESYSSKPWGALCPLLPTQSSVACANSVLLS